MAQNDRSKIITGGVERSPKRAMLRAVGFGDDDFNKPIIAVANGVAAKYAKLVSSASLGAVTD